MSLSREEMRYFESDEWRNVSYLSCAALVLSDKALSAHLIKREQQATHVAKAAIKWRKKCDLGG